MSETIYSKYEAVIGLEVHMQLDTKTKAYCSDENLYGAPPNTLVSPTSAGFPGTLPVLNEKVIEYAIRLGIACGSDINKNIHFARKNYFYPDLPKGYQVTQDKTPICTLGSIDIKDENDSEKKINLIRIHIEEDAGKSIHDQDPYNTLVDLNRAGVPLLEMVSAPDIKTSKEAYNYLQEVRKLVRYLGICDGNMEEGSLRCDANISVMPKGSKVYGNRVEVKNMNSMRNVQKAIEFEIKRQIDLIEEGKEVLIQTRSFNAADNSTIAMRSKEMAHDYRYFPEPDLQPMLIEDSYIQKIKTELPPLPNELFVKYTNELNLSEYDANNLIEEKEIALYFEEILKYTSNYKAAANWVMGSVKSYLNEKASSVSEFPLEAKQMAGIIKLIDDGLISNSIATQKVFPALLQTPTKSAEEIAKENAWIQNTDTDEIFSWVQQAIDKYPDKVEEYKNGKKGLVGLFMGEVMKLSKGKANPKEANKLVIQELNK